MNGLKIKEIDRDELVSGKNLLFLALAIITVVSWVLSGSIYGEGSVFNSAPSGNAYLDGFWQSIPNIFKTMEICFLSLVIAVVLHFVLRHIVSKTKGGMTAVKLISSFLKYIIAIVALLWILTAWGVDTTTLIASAGIMGLVIGLGAQSLIADIIAGMFTVFEGEYQVGDIVVIDGWRGTVDEIGIRTTKIVDAGGNIKIINNSEISSVVNQTKAVSSVSTVMSIEYGESLQRVEIVIRDNIDKIRADIPQIVDGPFYKGVKALGASSVDLLFITNCKEEDYFVVQRAMNRELKLLFDANNINIPYPQIVLNRPVAFENDPAEVPKYVDRAADRFVDEQNELSKEIEEEVTSA